MPVIRTHYIYVSNGVRTRRFSKPKGVRKQKTGLLYPSYTVVSFNTATAIQITWSQICTQIV